MLLPYLLRLKFERCSPLLLPFLSQTSSIQYRNLKMGQTPSIPTDLTRELRVIGAGFSRTGTVSLALALERLLQGPVMHSGTASLMREEGKLSPPILPSR